ncbi:unnamed protein product [Paramecium primaurelia]|uniref:Tetratricopeptide repeat protein n=1 Tax=Paramecium primaurelia TaxID=5886 RepID=A0A8S1JR26_PARPR|nr:unnamed protein product [Paramecium primaurelia]
MGNIVPNDKDFMDIIIHLQNKNEEELEKMIIGLVIFKKKIEKLEKIDKDAAILFVKMIIYCFTNDPPKAIQIGEEIKLKHQYLHVYLLQEFCYMNLGLIGDAERCLKQALDIKPQRVDTIFSLYKLSMRKEDYQNAFNYLNEIKKFDRSPTIHFLMGITYQKMNQHDQAILCFEIAHQQIQNQEYFLHKMESFLALEKYEEALECCMIVIINEPGNKYLQEKLQYLLKLLGIDEEQHKMKLLKLQQEHNYTLETYKEKRALEAQQTQLILRQSKIRVKPDQGQINQTQSQIKLNKQNQQITYYLDALYYTFTQFFGLYVHLDQNCSSKIAQYLSTKQNIEILKFTDMIRQTIQQFYPDLTKLSIEDLSNRLTLWYNKKIKENEEDIFQHLFKIFYNLNQTNFKQKLIERLNEDFSNSIERKNKNKEFYLYLTEICRAVEKEGFQIYKESGGQLGLEHAIIILGFIIKFTDLVNDDDSFENIIFRGLNKDDFYQFFQSQSRIQIKNSSQKQCILERDEMLVSTDLAFMSKFF